MVRFIERVNSVQINAGNSSVVVIGAEVARRAIPMQHRHFGKPHHGKRPSSAAPASGTLPRWCPGLSTGSPAGSYAGRCRRDRCDRDVQAAVPAPGVATQTRRPGTADMPAPAWAAVVLSRAMCL